MFVIGLGIRTEFLQKLCGLDKKIDLLKLDRLMAINLSLTIDTIKQAIQAVEDGEGGFVVANILADYYVDNNIDAYRLLNELNWESALKI
tara:strand:- start:484 stop:753 length:270 start_codon:yes stop_codon:yes gene_type:complete